MSRISYSVRAGRLSMWLGGAALAFGMFVRITRELIEGDVSAMDSAILLAVTKKRTPLLTVAALDVTALGSITLVVLFSAFTLVVLLVLRDRLGALQLLGASAGAGILTLVTKNIIERIRPEEAQQLISSVGLLIGSPFDRNRMGHFLGHRPCARRPGHGIRHKRSGIHTLHTFPRTAPGSAVPERVVPAGRHAPMNWFVRCRSAGARNPKDKCRLGWKRRQSRGRRESGSLCKPNFSQFRPLSYRKRAFGSRRGAGMMGFRCLNRER
jgi:hypothetical protein